MIRYSEFLEFVRITKNAKETILDLILLPNHCGTFGVTQSA